MVACSAYDMHKKKISVLFLIFGLIQVRKLYFHGIPTNGNAHSKALRQYTYSILYCVYFKAM